MLSSCCEHFLYYPFFYFRLFVNELNYYSFNTWNSTAVSTTIALVMV